MVEKLSEINIRKEFVEKLKNKIKNEINFYRERYVDELNPNIDNDYPEFEMDYKFAILERCALYALEDYINEDFAFMAWEMQDTSTDKIIYTIPLDMIELMLQDDFHFIIQLFSNLNNEPRNYYFIGNFLNDQYFAYDFVSIIEKALYDEKKKKEKK